MSNTGQLIYYDKSPVPQPDAEVTIDIDPNEWTCVAYGITHDVDYTIAPSWTNSVTVTSGPVTFLLPFSEIIKGGLSVKITPSTSCAAGDYSYVDFEAAVVVQQKGYNSYATTVSMKNEVTSTVVITSAQGIITGLE